MTNISLVQYIVGYVPVRDYVKIEGDANLLLPEYDKYFLV